MAAAVLTFGRAFGDDMSPLMLLAAEIALGLAVYAALSALMARPQIVMARDLLTTLRPARA